MSPVFAGFAPRDVLEFQFMLIFFPITVFAGVAFVTAIKQSKKYQQYPQRKNLVRGSLAFLVLSPIFMVAALSIAPGSSVPGECQKFVSTMTAKGRYTTTADQPCAWRDRKELGNALSVVSYGSAAISLLASIYLYSAAYVPREQRK